MKVHDRYSVITEIWIIAIKIYRLWDEFCEFSYTFYDWVVTKESYHYAKVLDLIVILGSREFVEDKFYGVDII